MATIKKIMCDNPECEGIIAHQVSANSIELKRVDQKFLLAGENWRIYASCQWCPMKTQISCSDGEINQEALRYKGDEPEPKLDADGNPIVDDDPQPEPVPEPKPERKHTKVA